MKKIGIVLIILSVSMLLFYFIYLFSINKNNQQNISEYIEQTSVVNNEVTEQENVEVVEENEETQKTINYKAILEIPSINLKQGLVDSTKNFASINYSVSIDKNSNYPNEMGNFILYAHSGNSSIAFFKNLNKVNINDSIYIYCNGVKYKYIVTKKYDIEKTGKAKVMSSNDDRFITLITCNQAKEGYQVVVVGKIESESKY